MDAIVIFCTVPTREDAKKISNAIIRERLAACVSTVEKVNSIFSWNHEMTSENELLLIIKTKRELFEKIEVVIKALHSYNIPEIIALPIIMGSQEYLGWIEHEVD